MGCRIIIGKQQSWDGEEAAVLFCSTTGTAFGPVMGSEEEAQAFIEFCPGDPRNYPVTELMNMYADFCRQRVCECGAVADGKPGQDENGTPYNGYPRTDGERFICNWCTKKQARNVLRMAKVSDGRLA